jgi:hypothetical protein
MNYEFKLFPPQFEKNNKGHVEIYRTHVDD